MIYHVLYPHDQLHNNWVVFSPPLITVKPQYADLVCAGCKKFDHDAVFAKGMVPPCLIRAKGDILLTSDNFICFHERLKDFLEAEGVSGLAYKQMLQTPWHVVNASHRVSADRSVYTEHKPHCPQCGRPRAVTGLIQLASQIKTPDTPKTIVAPEFSRQCSNGDRDLLFSQDVVRLLKENGFKGGLLFGLLPSDEEPAFRSAMQQGGNYKWKKGTKVIL